MRLSSFRVLCLILLLSAAPLPRGQINTASLSDPSGAAVPHATIKAVNSDTGYTRTSQSDGAGNYSLQDLPIGHYAVSVASPRFSSMSEQVTLDVGQRARQDFHLQIGSPGMGARFLLRPAAAVLAEAVRGRFRAGYPAESRNRRRHPADAVLELRL